MLFNDIQHLWLAKAGLQFHQSQIITCHTVWDDPNKKKKILYETMR